MQKYTSKDISGPFYEDYKGLIKLPTASYLLEKKAAGGYIIHASGAKVEIEDTNELKLKWENDKVVLYYENSALKLNGQDFIIEQDSIISKNKDDIIKEIKSGKNDVSVALIDIRGSSYYAIGLLILMDSGDTLTGNLNFINFDDKNDQVLQRVIKEAGGLYFATKEEGTCCAEITCISKKDGTCLPMYGRDEHYQFKLTATDALAAVDSLIKDKQDLSYKLNKITSSAKALTNNYASLKKLDAKVVKGGEISFGKYAAKIELEDKGIAGAFSKIGYYFYDNVIYIYDHFAKGKDSFSLPEHFHFLKVVKDEKGHYKLAFCNKYGHEYYEMPDDYRLINIEHVKGAKNIDFAKYYAKNGSFPSFTAKPSIKDYADSRQHQVDIYEIGNEKVGSLIDESAYYDDQGRFHYTSHQMGGQDRSYDLPSFTIAIGDNRCQSNLIKEGNNILNADHSNTVDCSLVEYVANYVNDYVMS